MTKTCTGQELIGSGNKGNTAGQTGPISRLDTGESNKKSNTTHTREGTKAGFHTGEDA